MPLAIGTLLRNRYRIVSILGQGGMGAVYRASDEHLHIPVAVKENLFLTEEYGRQFQREAHILAGLRHGNLPHVTDYFNTENQVQYLVMDFIEGEDLRQRMERMGALPERETILIGISICDALTYLHTRHQPIVHRDIKPGNIKVTPDGQAVLVDFGLAKIMQGSQVTSTGARAMTPGYSPPEQYGTARTDPRSDVYSLGATLYATLTGIIPEDGLNRLTGKSELTPIRELAPKVNRRLAETIECALEVDPEDRFQTAEEFKQALVQAGELVNYFPERPIIPPPPEVGEKAEPNGILEGDLLEVQTPKMPDRRSHSARRPRSRRKNRTGWVLVPIMFLVIAGASLLFAMRPDLSSSVLGYFTGSPTPPAADTEIASLQASATAQPTATVDASTPTAELTLPLAGSAVTEPPLETTPAPVTEVTSAPTATPRGGGSGQLAFASDKIGVMQVWLLDIANPKNQRRITDSKDGACQPAWSPDGLRLAFISPCAGKADLYRGSNIYIVNVDAEGNADPDSLKQITSSLEGDFDPAWSPDGKRIAFTSLINGKSAIYIIQLDDMTITEISRSRFPDKHPAWNPRSMQLAFVRQAPHSQIWYMTDNGQPQHQFTVSGAVNNLWPAWSVDGEILFFSQASLDGSGVPVLVYRRYEDRGNATENRIATNATAGPIVEVDPSPDGFWLAYESWPDGNNHDIYMMSVNGSNQTRLTTDPGLDFGAAYRPLVAAAP